MARTRLSGSSRRLARRHRPSRCRFRSGCRYAELDGRRRSGPVHPTRRHQASDPDRQRGRLRRPRRSDVPQHRRDRDVPGPAAHALSASSNPDTEIQDRFALTLVRRARKRRSTCSKCAVLADRWRRRDGRRARDTSVRRPCTRCRERRRQGERHRYLLPVRHGGRRRLPVRDHARPHRWRGVRLRRPAHRASRSRGARPGWRQGRSGPHVNRLPRFPGTSWTTPTATCLAPRPSMRPLRAPASSACAGSPRIPSRWGSSRSSSCLAA